MIVAPLVNRSSDLNTQINLVSSDLIDSKDVSNLRIKFQSMIDDKISNVLGVPEDIRLLAEDFVQTRLPLDQPSALERLMRIPLKSSTESDLIRPPIPVFIIQ